MDVNLQMMQWGGEPTGIGGGVKNTGKWLLVRFSKLSVTLG